MAALLNRAVRLAAIRLSQRQRVDVGAKHDRPPGPVTPQQPDHARLADARAHLVEPQLVQPLLDQRSGAMFLVRQLRVAMQVAPQLDETFRLLSRQHQRVASEPSAHHARSWARHRRARRGRIPSSPATGQGNAGNRS